MSSFNSGSLNNLHHVLSFWASKVEADRVNSKLEGMDKEECGGGDEGFKAVQPQRVKKVRVKKKRFILPFRQIKPLSGLKIKTKRCKDFRVRLKFYKLINL